MVDRRAYQRALRFVKRKHRGQFRSGRVPAWHHVARVSEILEAVFEHTREGSPQERSRIILAALGHDLLEDTDATEAEIREVFGEEGLEIIRGITNTWGDKHPAPYVRKVALASEGTRLAKLADLYDNISHVTYNIGLLGLPWVKSYFIPIVSPMRRGIVKTKFVRFRKSAAHLTASVNLAVILLEKAIKHFRNS